jgi:hypothetical protein
MMRPRKQLLLKLGVFLLLGAIVNGAISWGLWHRFCRMCIAGDVTLRHGTPDEEECKSWWSRHDPRVPHEQMRVAQATGAFGASLVSMITKTQTTLEPDRVSRKRNGFPTHSFEGRTWGLRDGSSIIEGMVTPTGQHPFPLIPLWPGFAINTIFYAAVLWLLWFAPGKIRRFIRIRGHRCPACGYQIAPGGGIDPVCSECGAALPAAWSTNASS